MRQKGCRGKAWVTEFLNDRLLLPNYLSNSIRGIKPHRVSVYHLPFPASLPRRLETLHVCQSTGLTHSILQHYLLFLEYILIISTKIRPTFNSFAQIPSLNVCLKWPLPSWALQHVMLLGGLCDLDHSLVCVVTFQKTWSTKLGS